MSLESVYSSIVKPCVVAFIRKWAAAEGQSLEFPSIVGTGFVVDECGIIATNRHVVEAFNHAPPEVLEDQNGPLVMAGLFRVRQTDGAMTPLFCDVVAAGAVDVPASMLTRYHPNQPDIAFAQINARGLKVLELDTDREVFEGMTLATAGFPMGADALMPNGFLESVNPTLQQGIVSGILPWPCPHPHDYLLNVMLMAGASGSPVFFPDSGKVAAIAYSGLKEIEGNPSCWYKVPTNLTFASPSRVVRTLLEAVRNSGQIVIDPNVPHESELLRGDQDGATAGGFPWEPR